MQSEGIDQTANTPLCKGPFLHGMFAGFLSIQELKCNSISLFENLDKREILLVIQNVEMSKNELIKTWKS